MTDALAAHKGRHSSRSRRSWPPAREVHTTLVRMRQRFTGSPTRGQNERHVPSPGSSDMPHPLTLLQISGRGYPPAPPSAEHLAESSCPGRVPQRRPEPARPGRCAAEIGVLVPSLARANGTPIVHVRHLGIQGGPVRSRRSPRGQFLPELQPEAREKVDERPAQCLLRHRAARPAAEPRPSRPDRLQFHDPFQRQHHPCTRGQVGPAAPTSTSACATRDIPTLNSGSTGAADLQRAEIRAALGDNFAAIVAQAGNCSDRPSSRPPSRPAEDWSACGAMAAAKTSSARFAHGSRESREPGRKVSGPSPDDTRGSRDETVR